MENLTLCSNKIFGEGYDGNKIHANMTNTLGNSALSFSTICNWSTEA